MNLTRKISWTHQKRINEKCSVVIVFKSVQFYFHLCFQPQRCVDQYSTPEPLHCTEVIALFYFLDAVRGTGLVPHSSYQGRVHAVVTRHAQTRARRNTNKRKCRGILGSTWQGPRRNPGIICRAEPREVDSICSGSRTSMAKLF